MKTIVLIYGSSSAESTISCISALYIYKILLSLEYKVIPIYLDKTNQWHLQDQVFTQHHKQKKHPIYLSHTNPMVLVDINNQSYPYDLIFPIIHGPYGEDGCLQGFCDFLNIPYTGANRLTSALCMHKGMFKKFLTGYDIPQVHYFELHKYDYDNNTVESINSIKKNFQLPIFVKPCNMGSSIGISKVSHWDDLNQAFLEAFKYDTNILIEQGIQAFEYEIALIGNYPQYELSTIGEIIVTQDTFYSYDSKYKHKNDAILNMNVQLQDTIQNQIHMMAKKAYMLIEGTGYARIDFLVDKQNQQVYLNEINTHPGFTPISMFPKLWEETGLPINDLIQKIIALAIDRYSNT